MIYSTSFNNLNKLFHTLTEFRDYGRMRLVNDLVFYKQRTMEMMTKTAEEIITKTATNAGVNCPAGNARVRVRGLAPSIDASASRLNAMAAERADTIATAIQAN